MTLLPAGRRRPIAVLILASQLLPAPLWGQGIPREFGAAGGPIDAIDCTNAQAIVTRLTTNLPNQDRLIANLEQQVAAARKAANAADERVSDDLLKAAKKEMTDIAKNYLEQTGQLKKLADALSKKGLSPEAQQKFVDTVTQAKASEEVWKAFKAGQQTGAELLASERRMWEDMARLNRLFVDSGIADQVFDGLVDTLMKTPATAPPAILAKLARVGIDVGASMAESVIEDRDARQANETLEILRAQRNKFKDKISDLNTKCLQPKKNTENTEKAENTAKPDPNTPAPAAPAVAKGGGSGKAVAGILTAAGAAAAGFWAYNEYEKSQALLDEFSTIPTGSSTSAPVTTTTGASAFNGTYRAQVTRSCVAGPFPASCSQAPENATCSPTNFTFTVTSGTIRDCGGNFGNGTVQSNGTYSGIYTGSANGVPISGTFQTSGTFILQGQTTSQGSSYTIRISVTKQ